MEKEKELISLADFYNQVRECVMDIGGNKQQHHYEMLHATLVQLFESLTEEQKACLNPIYLKAFSSSCRIVATHTSDSYKKRYAEYCKNKKSSNTEQL